MFKKTTHSSCQEQQEQDHGQCRSTHRILRLGGEIIHFEDTQNTCTLSQVSLTVIYEGCVIQMQGS